MWDVFVVAVVALLMKPFVDVVLVLIGVGMLSYKKYILRELVEWKRELDSEEFLGDIGRHREITLRRDLEYYGSQKWKLVFGALGYVFVFIGAASLVMSILFGRGMG